MKTSVKHLSETKVIATITVGADELKKAELVALTKLASEVKVPGFRKGKVPTSVVAKNVDPQTLAQQTLEDALSKAVAEGFDAEKIQPLDRPEVDVKKYVPGKELEFTAEAEILPKVTLGDYKKLNAKKETVKITDKDVNDLIDRMRESFAEKKDVTRAAKDGDDVVIDFVGKKDDVAFDGGTAADYTLKLGSNQFIPGFEEGVVGHKAGETFDIPLEFPKDYHAKELKGAKVVFSVTLKTVQERSLPEVNDEFAAKCGPFTSVDELKADITREMTDQKNREAGEKLKDELVKQLVEKSTIPMPEILVKDQERSIEQDFVQNLAYQGVSLDSYLETQGFKTKEEWLDKEVRTVAESRVKAGLALAELNKELKIDASREELEAHINLYKQQYANNKEALKQFDEPEVQRDIANRLLTEKTVEKLVELNTK
jgi:trigger factor